MKLNKGKFSKSIFGRALQQFLPAQSRKLGYEDILEFLQEEMEKSRRPGKEGDQIPNCFRVFLHSSDYQRLASRRMLDAIETGIRKNIIMMDVFVPYKLQLQVLEDNEVEPGDCELELIYETDDLKEESMLEDGPTMVLTRDDLSIPGNLAAKPAFAMLSAVDKNTIADDLELGEKQVYIGRRASNELILTDPNVSRMHALIKYEHSRHFLQDTNSLNGCFINEKRISGAYLKQNDKIRLGDTILKYSIIRNEGYATR